MTARDGAATAGSFCGLCFLFWLGAMIVWLWHAMFVLGSMLLFLESMIVTARHITARHICFWPHDSANSKKDNNKNAH